jgi:hypothetical protein
MLDDLDGLLTNSNYSELPLWNPKAAVTFQAIVSFASFDS